MRTRKTALYVHLVWTTWNRQPSIHRSFERRMYRCIEAQAREMGCDVLATGGADDHVHAELQMPSTLAVSILVKQMKGVSSRFINAEFKPTQRFRWQGGYGAFSISPWDVANVKEYVTHQRRHHAENTLIVPLEETFDEAEVGDDG